MGDRTFFHFSASAEESGLIAGELEAERGLVAGDSDADTPPRGGFLFLLASSLWPAALTGRDGVVLAESDTTSERTSSVDSATGSRRISGNSSELDMLSSLLGLSRGEIDGERHVFGTFWADSMGDVSFGGSGENDIEPNEGDDISAHDIFGERCRALHILPC